MTGFKTIGEYFRRLELVHVPAGSPEVCRTVAVELKRDLAPKARLAEGGAAPRGANCLQISVGRLPKSARRRRTPERWVFCAIDDRGRGQLAAADPSHLFAFYCHLVEDRALRPAPGLVEPSFAWQRPVWDLYFSQAARSVRGLDRDAAVRQMARFGFTHVEVNGLATPEGREDGVTGEVYPRFYTYCAALDQFVDSFLNRGIYPREYLHENLEHLRADARRAARYGLIPTITCFEPRSVPDALLARYPELRGARVDHPFRSFKPRYNLAVSHPVVRRHYRELVQNLLRQVPELGCMSVWTNDSGAGFEFTRSLYVGANGSAYLVREWSDPDVFTRSAARNVVEFLRLLRESGAEINPRFRVTTRLEPFVPERDAVLAGVGNGVDVEVASLFDRGWRSPYGHPRYKDCAIAPFTIYNNRFMREEQPEIRRLARRNCRTHVMYAHGPANNFEPLLAVPLPWLTVEKLKDLRLAGARHLAHFGGVAPPAAVRFNLNEEIFRRFQFDPNLDIEQELFDIAGGWAGPRHARTLLRIWRAVDRAVRAFHPNPLYFSWNVWYRILTRPLVPDIERIPERERRYYERHILSTHHNPNRFDLRRDVLFDLMPPDQAARAVRRIDARTLPPMNRAVEMLARALAPLDPDSPAHSVLTDQYDRLRALRCWLVTNRNVAAWISAVHTFLGTNDRKTRTACRRDLKRMVALEIANAAALLELLQESAVELLARSDVRETTFIHGPRLLVQLESKIELMRKYGGFPPRIDPDVMWRVARLSSRPASRGGARPA